MKIHLAYKSYKCEVCGAGFTREAGLRKHNLIHTSNFVIKCKICKASFKYQLGLTRHVRECHSNRSKIFQCPRCPKNFSFQSTLVNHQKNIHSRLMKITAKQGNAKANPKSKSVGMESKVCSKTNLSKNRLSLSPHLKSDADATGKSLRQNKKMPVENERNTESRKCGICGIVVSRKEHLRRHYIIHTKVSTGNAVGKASKCQTCNANFNSQRNLTRHNRDVHNILFQCTNCSQKFISRQKFFIHRNKCRTVGQVKRKTTPNQKISENVDAKLKFQCQICLKVCFTKHRLMSHLPVHGTERSFKCETCPATFKFQTSLQRHSKVHMEKTVNEDSVHLHVRRIQPNRNNRRNFTCVFCSKTYCDRRIRDRHLLTHRNERPFQCKFCKIRFAHEWAMRRHSASIHLKSNFKGDKASKPKSLKCNVCSQVFSARTDTGISSFEAHMNTHAKARPHQCKICKAQFKTPTTLMLHRVKHQVRKFQCKACKGQFRLSYDLKMHLLQCKASTSRDS